ncbi:MAG TPA: helix-turn-helix transcriptional regulator [Pseudomonadales bacterium]|nr:helix-turn-helix transcriptional regulator [Pseudomonadales bacterium]
MSVFSKRLREARLRAGLTQEGLGVLAGIDEMTASPRMNQYEKGKHEPDFSMVERIAKALKLPAPYFYTADDQAAELLLGFHRLKKSDKAKLLQALSEML